MFGGLDQVFGLKVNFDTARIDAGNYGFECWKIFWSSFDMEIFGDMLSPKCYLFSGDSGGPVFSICIESMVINPEAREFIKKFASRLIKNSEFSSVAAVPELENYEQSVAFNQFLPLIPTIEIEWGRVKLNNEGVSYDAFEALKLYKDFE